MPFLAALALLTACDRKDAKDLAADSLMTSVAAIPKTGHVMAFDLGRALDQSGRIYGGVSSRFSPSDTLFLSVRTQYVMAGAPVAARILQGRRTVDSANAPAAAADSTGIAFLRFHFAQTKGWAPGKYQVEVFLDGKSQGLKDFEVVR